MGFSQSILTPNTIGWLVLLIFQLCADRIKLPWWRLRLCGGLACSRNLPHYSRKQFVAVAAFDYGMFICFESPPVPPRKAAYLPVQIDCTNTAVLFWRGHLIVIRQMSGMSQWWVEAQSICCRELLQREKEKFGKVFIRLSRDENSDQLLTPVITL